MMIKKYKCLRCGHTWIPRIKKRPINCPVCKNPKWDIPKAEGELGAEPQIESPAEASNKAHGSDILNGASSSSKDQKKGEIGAGNSLDNDSKKGLRPDFENNKDGGLSKKG